MKSTVNVVKCSDDYQLNGYGAWALREPSAVRFRTTFKCIGRWQGTTNQRQPQFPKPSDSKHLKLGHVQLSDDGTLFSLFETQKSVQFDVYEPVKTEAIRLDIIHKEFYTMDVVEYLRLTYNCSSGLVSIDLSKS